MACTVTFQFNFPVVSSVWSRNSKRGTYLVLQRRVRHTVYLAVRPWLSLLEQRRAEHDSEVLHRHGVVRLVLGDTTANKHHKSQYCVLPLKGG